jgi:predicted DNA-binding transcriptional regulator YafY
LVDNVDNLKYDLEMRKTERLLYILSLLRTSHRLRARDLARKCDVTERTIYRDITSISAANIPIYFDGGYKLLHNGFLPPANLTSYETEFILGLLKSPILAKSKISQDTIKRIANKITLREAPALDADIISIGSTDTEKPGGHKFAPLIEGAIRNRHLIKISYLSLKGEKTTRKIAPYAICFRHHAWYLIGFCHLRNEVRTFRIGRIDSIELSREQFERPANFSVEDYFGASLGVYRGTLTAFKVLFRGEAAVSIRSSQHHPSERITQQQDGSLIYEAELSGVEEFVRWILGYGPNAEILEPLNAREAIKSILAASLGKYH